MLNISNNKIELAYTTSPVQNPYNSFEKLTSNIIVGAGDEGVLRLFNIGHDLIEVIYESAPIKTIVLTIKFLTSNTFVTGCDDGSTRFWKCSEDNKLTL